MSDRRKYLLLVGAIAAALVGALLIALPSSPVQKKPTLGLDLRGGLEVVLKAVPPKGHTLTPDDMSRSISIMQNRINKLGVSEPEIRKQGNNQIVIQLAGVHDPAAAAALIGKTAQLMLFDFENDLTGPSLDVNGNPIATPTLYSLLTSVKKQAAKGTPNEYYLFKTTTITKPAKTKNGKPIGKPTHTTKHSLVAGPVDSKEKLLRPFGGKVPRGSRGPRGAGEHARRQLPDGERLPRRPPGPDLADRDVLLPPEVLPEPDASNPLPEMTGRDLVLSGTKADFGQAGGPDRDAPVHEPRLESVPEDHAGGGAARPGALQPRRQAGRPDELRAALRDRPRRPAAVDAVHRLQAEPRRNPRPERARSTWARAARSRTRRTSRSCSRPVRCPSASRRSSAPTSRRRSARTRCTRRQGGHRRPRRRRDLPARPLPLPRPRRGVRARDLRALLLRRDPALQRDADAAGLRRPDPDDRRRGRRERRRLRTHQGRSARREVREGRDLGRLRQGLPHDSRRERRHRDHRARAVPDRRRVGEGLRADAADRHDDLAADRGRRDARDARSARRLQVVQQPALHGRGGPADREVAPDRLHAASARCGSRSPARSSSPA